jgi:hypothetical protein
MTWSLQRRSARWRNIICWLQVIHLGDGESSVRCRSQSITSRSEGILQLGTDNWTRFRETYVAMVQGILIENNVIKQSAWCRVLPRSYWSLSLSRNCQSFMEKESSSPLSHRKFGFKWPGIWIVFERFSVWIPDRQNVSWIEIQVFSDVMQW